MPAQISAIGSDIAIGAISELACRPVSDAWVHPLGFIHVRLGTVGGLRRRVHIWPKRSVQDEPITALQIHNHAFEFRSRVLAGRVTHQPHSVVESTRGPCRLFEVHNTDRGASIVPTTKTCLVDPGPVTAFRASEEYEVRSGVFHRSAALDDLSATLVLARPISGFTSYVVGDRSQRPDDVVWVPVSSDSLKAVAERILEQLR